jgi:hypothetical protein
MGIGFPQQRRQGEAQQLAERNGNGLPIAHVAGLKPDKALHQIEGRAVDLNRINRRPAMQSLAPTSGVSGASLPKGGRRISSPQELRRFAPQQP